MSIRSAVAGAAVLAALVFGAFIYGKGEYRSGYADSSRDSKDLAQRVEQGMRYEKEKADARLRAAVLAREVAERDLVSARGSLDGLLRSHSRNPANPATSPRADGADPDWIGGFATCYAEYSALASDAAVWADRVNGLQDWARVVQRKTNETP